MCNLFSKSFLFFFITTFNLLFDESTANCDGLSDADKFSTECASIVTIQTTSIFLNQNFTLQIESLDFQVVNISIFASSNDYCNVNSFADGIQCVFSETKDDIISQTMINSRCLQDDTSVIAAGEVILIIGFTNCAANLPVSLNQSTSIEISDDDVSETHYIAETDSDAVLNITCLAIPQGSDPILSFTPFNNSETADFQSYPDSNGAIVGIFLNGIVSGVLSCDSINGYTSVTYITLVEDLPIAYYPSGNNQSVVVGDFLNISVVVLVTTNEVIDPDSISFISVGGSDENNPTIESIDEIHYNIVYDHVGIIPTNSYELCFTTTNADINCTDTFYLYVKETSVQLSTNLTARLFEDFQNGLVNISCLPVDLTATVFWQLADSTPLWEAYPDYIFFPSGLNHTVTLVSPPNGINVFSCGLYNYGETLLNEETVTVVALSNPVSLWNNNQEILQNDSIINYFSHNEHLLSLRCFGAFDNGELYWSTNNVLSLPNELYSDDEINGLTISSGDRDTTISYSILNSQQSGYYTCASNSTDSKFTVFVTPDNPFWKVISSNSIKSPIGTNETIIIQYAHNSEGHGNNGMNLSIALEVQPQNSQPYFRFQNLMSDPNQYLYNYTFTLGKNDRAEFVFQAQYSEITISSSVNVYSIVPQFTYVSTPVYARLGRIVTLSCIANETTAPIVWGISNYEEYYPINNEPGFSFTPPIINEEISFNISSNTLDDGQNYFYDVDSGSYSQLECACGFQDGDNEGLSDASEIVLNIKNYDILLENIYGFTTIKNNSIVNVFSLNDKKKRNVEHEFVNSFLSRCTTTQGNHDTFWVVEFFDNPESPEVINSSYSDAVYTDQVNQYVSELNAFVVEDTSGKYTCTSSITGIFQTFILTNENPFVRVKSQVQVHELLGETIIMTFLAATNSDGDTNKMSDIEVIFTDKATESTTVLEAEQKCILDETSSCYEYELSIVASPTTAGLYTGRVVDNCLISENGTEVCTYAEDIVTVTVEVPDLIPSHIEHKVFVGQPLALSCTPSEGDFIISWQHNGVTIPGLPADNKRNAILSDLSPFPYNYDLFLSSSLFADTGIYTCSLLIEDEVILTHSINVTVSEVPSIESSTNLAANLIEEFDEGLVTITCLPSDNSAIIFWELHNGIPLLDMYPNVLLTPANLNHTVTFTSAPNGINTVICGLYNNGGVLLNIRTITVVALSGPVSMWNNNQQLQPDAVINSFNNNIDDKDLPFLSLRCFSTQGNGILQWSTDDMLVLLDDDNVIDNLTVIGSDRDITLRIDNQKATRFICSSNVSQNKLDVLVTLDNPYWSIISQTSIKPPIGTNESIIFQYAYNSEGYRNTGTNLQLSLMVEPDENEPYYIFQEMQSNPNKHFYIYTFTASKNDRGKFVFEVEYGDIFLSSKVTIYSIVPHFTLVSTPVYARLGRIVTLSCTANETTAPIVWGISNYEEYYPINNEPGFSFTPPIINKEISFNISSNTLDDGQNYFYDVDSGSYSQLEFACGFQDGYDKSLSNFETVQVNIEKYDIDCVSTYGESLLNNSVVNYIEFQNQYSKRFSEFPNSLEITCTTVQGNHDPIWKAEFFATPNFPGVISDTYSETLYSKQTNPYVSQLNALVTGDTSGYYKCESFISGIFLNFVLTSENPLVKAKSENTVTGFLGKYIGIRFYAALDSTGYSCEDLPLLEVIHTLPNGSNETLYAQRGCDYDCTCFEYVLEIEELVLADAGSYTGRLGKCNYFDDDIVEDNGGCNYATDTVVLNFQVPDLMPSFDDVQTSTGAPIQLSCSPSYGNVLAIDIPYEISWLHNGSEITIDEICQEDNFMNPQESCLFPYPYNTNLVIVTTSVNDSGIYTCNLIVEDEIIITSANINVTIIPSPPPQFNCFVDELCGELVTTTESITDCCHGYTDRSYANENNECVKCPIIQCPVESNSGILWDATNAGSYASASCDKAGRQFSAFKVITRECLSSGNWGPFDFINCTLRPDVNSFATVSIVLDESEIENAMNSRNLLEESLQAILDDFNLTYTGVSVKSIVEETATVDFEIEFDSLSDDDVLILSEIQSSLMTSDSFGEFTTELSQSQLYVLKVANSCPCTTDSTNLEIELVTKCSTPSSINPCQCQNEKCQCQSPYVGDGMLCTFDTDGDLYPDEPLETCNIDSNKTYCTMDNCATVFNPDQNPDVCMTIPDFTGCRFSADTNWGIEWANIGPGQTDTQPCPPGTIGVATRFCSLNGKWEEPNVINCLPEVYQNLLDQADAIISSTDNIQTRVSQVVTLTQELANASSQNIGNTESLLPASINSTNQILRAVLGVLFESLDSGDNFIHATDGLQVAVVINNLLQTNQLNGWNALQTSNVDSVLGSDTLLLNIEEYGLYLSLSRNDTVVRQSNFAIRAKQYSVSKGTLSFPQPGDLDGTDFPPQAAGVSIPVEALTQTLDENGQVSVVSTLCLNIETILEAIDRNDNNQSRPASLVWSGQVSIKQEVLPKPINLTFRVNINNTNNTEYTYRCVFWNGTEQGFSSAGVSTVGSRIDDYGNTVVDCQSYHLTPFAVLVDVAGSIQDGSTEYKALQVVSYIGCTVSLVCLFATIVFFLSYGKKLFTSVHFFVHLNLAISLFCAYLVFVAGVETARGNQIGCGFVAALLHYLFLSSFCWMLCEGIMLYLMLVVVFSSLSKRWYFFLAIGWVPSLLPVIIGLAAGYNQYGVRNEEGDLQFCWLSTRRGVIWAFVAPMIIIVLINIGFLILALRSVWRTSKGKKYKSDRQTRNLAVSLLKATLILLPLLGLTWLFGLLSVDQNTSVFAWIFTILNTAQGVAIFFFHVVRSDRVWSKFTPYLNRFQKKTESSSTSNRTSTYRFSGSRGSTLKSYAFKNAGFKTNTFKKTTSEIDIISELPEFELTKMNDDEPKKTPLPSIDEEENVRIRRKEKEAASYYNNNA